MFKKKKKVEEDADSLLNRSNHESSTEPKSGMVALKKKSEKQTILNDEKQASSVPIEENTKNDGLEEETIFNNVIDYFIAKEALLLGKLRFDVGEYETTKKTILKKAREQFELRCGKNKILVEKLMERFIHYMWGYYVLEDALADPEIFDIRTRADDIVLVRRFGEWQESNIRFLSDDDYQRFVRMICTRNKKNISNINAQVKFSDNTNNDDYILRFNITSGLINTSGKPSVHIRKLPKNKLTVKDLVGLEYMTETQAKYLVKNFKEGKGILFTGATGSGKTYGMSALLEYFPKGKAGLVIQETDEIFSDNPMIQVQHVVEENGEGKISYGLHELATFGLMDAVDLFVLGEVKSGRDAAALPMVAATGSQIMLSCHGDNEKEAIYKVADYMKQSTGYDLNQCLRFLSGINIIVYCNRFKIQGICENHGWDYKNDSLMLEPLNIATCKKREESTVTNFRNRKIDFGEFIDVRKEG